MSRVEGQVSGQRTATWTAGSWAVYDYDDARSRLSAERRWIAGAPDLPYVTGYSYDVPDRLTGASATGGSLPGYNRSYSYKEIGNLMGKGGIAYGYPASGVGSIRPHAVITTSDGGAFGYDANPTPLRYGDCAAT